MSFAARITDMILSTITVGPLPIISPAAPTVMIGGLPAAGLGSSCGTDAVIMGSTAVMLGGIPAARVGDPSAGGGVVIGPGAPTVSIG
jgi:uncharacterized Zn-binding protein involved in type VI secretion